MAIDDRKQRILMAIVSLYANAGEPVGSNLLSRYFNMAVSSATLRNEMAALTKLGLLEQPHTSAGRVPSAKGYRYYVDHLLFMQAQLTEAEQREIDTLFDTLDYDPEKLAHGAARALADMLGYAVAVTTPRSEDTFIAHFEALQVGRYSAVVLAVTGAGSVLTRVAKVDEELNSEELSNFAKALNSKLRFVKEPDATPTLKRALSESLGQSRKKLDPLLRAALTLLEQAGKPSFFFEGQQYLLQWPELEPGLRMVLELMADEQHAAQLLRMTDSHTRIILGDELEPRPIPGLCTIARQYIAGSGMAGSIAVLGPTRMKFSEVIPRLEYFSELLGKTMSGAGTAR